ncbi:tRNA-binding protein [Novosphingobium resinovorum]|uniref:tRNA-binding protein n=1 Tax=Novosphingobium resinovorum TaxID=158500 RepID=UPI002ED3D361|nr:tRNA-binding protein [Novosphingobium resinovorum]
MMAQAKDITDFDTFAALDIRVGTVVEVQEFPRARNPSYKVAVDLGALGVRWSSAQVTNYTPEDLLGTQVCCVVNFAPRNIAGFRSEVLILGAPGEGCKVIVVTPRSTVENGAALF